MFPFLRTIHSSVLINDLNNLLQESVSIRSKPKTESQPPRSQDPHRRPATKQQHQPHQDHHHTRLHRQPSPAITNNSRKSSPPSRRKSSLSSTGDEDRKATVVVQPAKERKPLQQLAAALAEEDRRSVERRSNRRRSSDSFRSYSECSPPESPERLTGVSPRRGSPRRGTSPRGGAARNRSISGRGARDQSPGKRSRTSSGRGTGDPTVSSTGKTSLFVSSFIDLNALRSPFFVIYMYTSHNIKQGRFIGLFFPFYQTSIPTGFCINKNKLYILLQNDSDLYNKDILRGWEKAALLIHHLVCWWEI